MNGVKNFLLLVAIIFAAIATWVFMAAEGYLGKTLHAGDVTASPIPQPVLENYKQQQHKTAANLAAKTQPASGFEEPDNKQILFGDLHVHTTFSQDAFLMSLPMLGGEGAHPPADACDFARYCSALYFWSINDHSAGISPQRWQETKDAIRQCNAVADPEYPDTVAFLGYEWTQVSVFDTNKHYGHKNVIFKHTEEDKVAKRPIAAVSYGAGVKSFQRPFLQRAGLPLLDREYSQRYLDYNLYIKEFNRVKNCPDNISSDKLPADCIEWAATSTDLFKKLDEAGHESIVIPHGNVWGLYTPTGITWDKQLMGANHNEKYQFMFELYSGHGNSEEYREWRASERNINNVTCPQPSAGYMPTCWMAGNIIQERCLSELGKIELGSTELEKTELDHDNNQSTKQNKNIIQGKHKKECEARAEQARKISAIAGMGVIPGATAEDWLDAGQCTDCFQPAFNHRPAGSGQYALAITNFDDPENPKRFKFGFMASSDGHSARPGTGYKEVNRREYTEAAGGRSQMFTQLIAGEVGKPTSRALNFNAFTDAERRRAIGVRLERQASFFLTGGLIAAHSTGRNRDAIWDAMQRKEVYGTSGPRILLWFDLLNGENGKSQPMGSEVRMKSVPKFRVRAAGSLKQKPGCPEYSVNALDKDRLEYLCRGECYNPLDERRKITRIEVIKIQPQQFKNEVVDELIQDAWLRIPCPPNGEGCMVEFEDPDFQQDARDTVYYVRAIEEPSMVVNANNLRCETDEGGNCTKVNMCYGDSRTDYQEDCLDESEQRAWSSPIFVNYMFH